MSPMNKMLKLAAVSLLGLGISLVVAQAQGPGVSVTPANPTILVGQTQQFTAAGMSIPATIDGGGNHACLLMSDRSVQCFGQNNWGQLGDGHIGTNASTPVAVSGLTTAVDVGAGMEHSCALLADGTMRCWGTSYVGQLGDGTFNGWADVPKPVLNLSGAIAGVVGGFHTCAILSDRSMRCWGRNQDGQVGNGDNTTDVSVPHTVIGLGGPVSTAIAGGYHTCALMPDATVRCWGRNTRGQLGDGTNNFFSSTPVPVSGMTNAAAVSGGTWHTCALLRDGTVQCWGENDNGQIGNTLSHSNVPVTVAGISNAVAISTGTYHSCAVLTDGTTRCWGRNDDGQLGNGTTVNSSSPVQVSGLSGPIQIATGIFHSCALMPDRSGRCWGDNSVRSARERQRNRLIDASERERDWGTHVDEQRYHRGHDRRRRPGDGPPSRRQHHQGDGWFGKHREYDAHRQESRGSVGRSRRFRHRQRELESSGNRLRNGLHRILSRRYGSDPDGSPGRRIHLDRLDRMRFDRRPVLYRGHDRSTLGHCDVSARLYSDRHQVRNRRGHCDLQPRGNQLRRNLLRFLRGWNDRDVDGNPRNIQCVLRLDRVRYGLEHNLDREDERSEVGQRRVPRRPHPVTRQT